MMYEKNRGKTPCSLRWNMKRRSVICRIGPATQLAYISMPFIASTPPPGRYLVQVGRIDPDDPIVEKSPFHSSTVRKKIFRWVKECKRLATRNGNSSTTRWD